MVFKKILVPTDLTNKSIKALDVAVNMLSADAGDVTLLHVIETIAEADDDEFKDFYERLRSRARKKMEEMIRPYAGKKRAIRSEVAYGKRAAEIVKYAARNDVDLIVLSSHRIEKIDPAEGWATISYRVAILAHCPVMMVK
jgi:universal stress protein A